GPRTAACPAAARPAQGGRAAAACAVPTRPGRCRARTGTAPPIAVPRAPLVRRRARHRPPGPPTAPPSPRPRAPAPVRCRRSRPPPAPWSLPSCNEKGRAVVAHGAPDVTADYAFGSAQAPVGPELAFLGEAVVDPLHPLLVRTAGGLVALGQHPGAQGVAHPRQGRHVALEGNHRLALGLDEDVLDRAFQLDVQLAGRGRGLG